jgi:hypothetical protein
VSFVVVWLGFGFVAHFAGCGWCGVMVSVQHRILISVFLFMNTGKNRIFVLVTTCKIQYENNIIHNVTY